MRTREECLDAAAQLWADCIARTARMTPEQIADEAFVPGGPSKEDIAAWWHDRRGTTPVADAA